MFVTLRELIFKVSFFCFVLITEAKTKTKRSSSQRIIP